MNFRPVLFFLLFLPLFFLLLQIPRSSPSKRVLFFFFSPSFLFFPLLLCQIPRSSPSEARAWKINFRPVIFFLSFLSFFLFSRYRDLHLRQDKLSSCYFLSFFLFFRYRDLRLRSACVIDNRLVLLPQVKKQIEFK